MAYLNEFKSSTFALNIFGTIVPCYAALSSLILNIVVAVVLSAIFNALFRAPRIDATAASDYT
jgi:SSS family solute:Na+ symporter